MTETVAFTGTRRFLTGDERIRVAEIIRALPKGTRIVTGGCVGLDAFVAYYAHACGYHVHTIVPADRSRVDPGWRQNCTTFKEMPKGTTYRDRNVEIVSELTEEDDTLYGVPDHDEHEAESWRSGTWQTIRLARKAGKPVDVHVLSDPRRPSPPRVEE